MLRDYVKRVRRWLAGRKPLMTPMLRCGSQSGAVLRIGVPVSRSKSPLLA
jgi:hypothetical protein